MNNTDLDELIKFLTSVGISYTHYENAMVTNSQFITIKSKTDKVAGTAGREAEFHFDSAGNFVGMGLF